MGLGLVVLFAVVREPLAELVACVVSALEAGIAPWQVLAWAEQVRGTSEAGESALAVVEAC